jgi:hypothetical protein
VIADVVWMPTDLVASRGPHALDYYEPLGPLARPGGRPRGGGPEGSNLIWLRAGDEADMIESLAEAGLIVVSVAEDRPGG